MNEPWKTQLQKPGTTEILEI